MLTEGKFETVGEELASHTLNNLDDSSIIQSMDAVDNFDKERVASPLRDIMEKPYAILKDEMENLQTVGPSEYLNDDPAFDEMLQDQLNAVKRIGALIYAAATVNPLINDFRQHHKGIIHDELKDKILTILEEDDASTLLSEVNRVYRQLDYLKRVNDYNKNNVLTRLLKEDGYELVSKVATLRELSNNEEIVKLIPSLNQVNDNDALNNYFDNYKLASEDEKLAALPELALIENNIFKDVQALTEGDKEALVNLSFSPIRTSTEEFYAPIKAEEPLNDGHKTIYLATIYGSSTVEFYAKYAGAYDSDAEAFTNLNKTPYIPFAKQENAVRVANLVMTGDRAITRMLLNAYSYENFDGEESEINYGTPAYDSFDSEGLMAILGAPGSGKTTAALYNIMNMIPDKTGDTIILAPKERQLNGLRNALVDGGFIDRIDERSDTVRSFLKGLGIQLKEGGAFDFDINDTAINYSDESETNAQMQAKFKQFLNRKRADVTNSGILDTLDISKDGILNKNLVNALAKTRLIAIDEFTHINPIDMAILNRIISLYNKHDVVRKDSSKRITIITLGDRNQLGFIDADGARRDYSDTTNVIISQPLITSLRSGWDLINNTLVDVGRSTQEVKHIAATQKDALTSSEVIQRYRNNPIRLFNHEGPTGNVGIKSIKGDTVTAADLAFISANRDIPFKNKKGDDMMLAGKDIVYVIQSADKLPEAQALLRDAFGADWAETVNIEVYNPDEVQGGEYRYAIIHAQPKFTEGSEFNIVRAHEFLNTMLSRATEATLLIDNGSMDQYVSFSNTNRERAINQTKINADVIKRVKANKQRVIAAILGSDYVPEGAKPGSKLDNEDAPQTREIPVQQFNKVLFTDPIPEISNSTAKVSNITAYTTFSTKKDFDTVYKLSTVPTGTSKEKVEEIIQALKYYVVRGPEINEGNVAVAPTVQAYLKDYDYDSPKFFLELTRRVGDNVLDGRSELRPKPKQPKELFTVKIKLNNNSGGDPLVLTLGVLNDFDLLIDKFKSTKTTLDQGDRDVNSFVKELMAFSSGKVKEVSLDKQTPIGTIENGVWSSREFTPREWKEMTTTWGSRLYYSNKGQSISFRKFKEMYPDFHISDPQVVVALLKNDANEIVLDKDGTNPEYMDYWQKMKGSGIAFITEYKELQAFNTDQLLSIYLKQLDYFANPAFKSADAIGKQAIIDGITEKIEIDKGRFYLPYKPNMVKLIRLNNPTASFINFRERYLTAIGSYKKGTPIQQLFEQFDMSPYVKDRLVKSLLTIRQFLKDSPDNTKYFETEILPGINKNAEDRISKIRQDALDLYGEVADFDQDFSKHDNFNEVVLDQLGTIDSAKEFIDKLDTLLELNGPNSIFRRKFETVPGKAIVKDRKVSTPVLESDLALTLTAHKPADFANSIIDLDLLNLFKKTKSLNFAEMIDASLKAFAKFPNEKRFEKYRLDAVFKDGQIETMVTAASKNSKVGDTSSNVLTDVAAIGDSYTFGFDGLQQAALNIDFTKVLANLTGEKPVVTRDEITTLQGQVSDRISTLLDSKLPTDWLEEKFAKQGSIDPNVALSEITGDLDAEKEMLLAYNDVLDRLNETVRIPQSADLQGDTVIAVQVSPNGIVAEFDVEHDVKKNLIEGKFTPFKKATHEDLTLQLVESTNKKATFSVTHEGEDYKVTYTLSDRSVEVFSLPKLTDDEFKEQFAAAASEETEKDPERILTKAVDELGKSFLAPGMKAGNIAVLDDFKSELGRKLFDLLSDGQVNELMPEGWRRVEALTYETEEMGTVRTPLFYKTLTNGFFDHFMDPKDQVEWFTDALTEVKNNIDQTNSGALNDDAEPVLDTFTTLPKMKKTQEPLNKMDRTKQDIKDADARAKEQFEYKVRELFKGKQGEPVIKDWIKDYELLHRAAIINKYIKENGVTASPEELEIPDDIRTTDSVKLANTIRMNVQANEELEDQYGDALKQLVYYRIEKTQTNC